MLIPQVHFHYSSCRPLLVLLCLIFIPAHAYTIDESCFRNAQWNTNLPARAVEEALNMAAYASFRMEQNDPKVGAVLQQFLGDGGDQALISKNYRRKRD